MRKFEHLGGVAAIARATSLAIDHGLGVDADGSGRVQIVEDVETISDGRGGSLSPA